MVPVTRSVQLAHVVVLLVAAWFTSFAASDGAGARDFDNCFLAGTLVDTTTRGRVPVEDVRVDDRIAPPPGHEGCQNPRCGYVVELFRNVTDQVVVLELGSRPQAREHRAQGGGGEESGGEEDGEPPSASQTIRCTPGHPFFVAGRGWVYAGDLREGDQLFAQGARVFVRAIEVRHERAQTFNFESACHHTYRVAGTRSEASVLVHNMSDADFLGQLLKGASADEATDVRYAYERMTRLGYGLEHVDLRYKGSQGIDLLFSRMEGGAKAFATAEAKAASAAGGLKSYLSFFHRIGGRTGSAVWNVDRLQQFIRLQAGKAPASAIGLATQALGAAKAGRLRSYAALAGANQLWRLPRGWGQRTRRGVESVVKAILIRRGR